MSNIVTITRTKFVNTKTGESTLGYRVYDNYAQDYNNCMDSIPNDDMELLRLVSDNASDIVSDMLTFICESAGMIQIDDEFYDFDQTKHILEPNT